MRAQFRSWLRSTLHRSAAEQEMDEELQFHLQAYTERLMRGSMERSEAERRARLEFGGMEQTKADCRRARAADLVESLGADIAYGLRLLRRTPGLTALALLIVALGIGATTAVLTVFRFSRISQPALRRA
jgi:hypothetical protein